MKQHNRFREDMLDLEDPAAAEDVVYVAAPATSARVEGDVAVLTLPADRPKACLRSKPTRPLRLWRWSFACSLSADAC